MLLMDAPGYTHAPGDLVAGRYTVGRPLGRGGFGEVYFATSTAGKQVAIKRLTRHTDVELRGVAACLNLKHPHLLALHDVAVDDDGTSWVVMEYVAGPSLREELDNRRGVPFSATETRRWLAGAAAGLEHLHDAGVIHRDVKPGNLFDDDSVVKLGDYGLAKLTHAVAAGAPTDGVGSCHYMAPEAGRGRYDAAFDWYGLGVILHEMTTGRLPFDGETPQEVMMRHLTEPPNLSLVPTEFRAAVAALLDKDPDRRPVRWAAVESLIDQPDRVASVPGTKPGATQRVSVPVDRSQTDSFKPSAGVSVKPLLAIILGVALLIHGAWLLPIATVIAAIYLPYFLMRQMALAGGVDANARGEVRRLTPMSKPAALTLIRDRLDRRPGIVRGAEAATSTMASIVAAAVLTGCSAVVVAGGVPDDAVTVAPALWVCGTAWAGTGLLMLLGWTTGKPAGRLWAAAVGLIAGGVAAGLGQYLLMDLSTPPPQWLANLGDVAPATLMTVHFGLLFGLLGATRLADPLRRRRLSIYSLAVAVVADWLVQQIVPVPQPFGMFTAAALVVTTGLATPWVHRSWVRSLTSGMLPPEQFATVPTRRLEELS